MTPTLLFHYILATGLGLLLLASFAGIAFALFLVIVGAAKGKS